MRVSSVNHLMWSAIRLLVSSRFPHLFHFSRYLLAVLALLFSMTIVCAEKIAFSSSRDGNYAIYVMDADGSHQTRLTNNVPGEFFPAISPNGQRIAFYSDPGGVSNEIYVMNSDGSNQTRLTTNTVNDSNPAFSPDGRKIVFQSERDGNHEIYVMNADGSNPTRLTNNADGDYYPAFSPDGRKIAFTASRDGNFEIYVMNADGSNQTRLTNNAVDDAFPAFSPDGQLIAFESLRDGNAEIYVMHADGSNPTRLTNNAARDLDPSFSPDGQKIVFLSLRDGSYVLYVMNADGSEQTRLTNFTNDINPYWGSLNPVITSFTPAHGWPGTAVTITGANLSATSGVSFNGTPALSWTADSNTQVTAVVPRGATSGPITVTTSYGTATSADPFTIVCAGKIAFSSSRDGNYAIYVMDADGSNQTRLTNNAAGEFFPAISPDGQRIVFYSDPGGVSNEIYVMNSDGSSQTRLTTNTVNDSNPAFSPDGRKIVFQSDRDGNFEIYVMNADGSNPTRLTNNADDDYYPAFSPDGRKIAFTSSHDGNFEIYVMDADGSNQTRLTNNAVDDAFPAFSPDGQLIAFESLRDGNAEIYVMHADGSNPTRLTNNAARDLDPSFSPDGQEIVFLSLRDGSYVLYLMNADGSTQTRLTNFTSDINPYWGSLNPVITGFTPAHGWPGTAVTITGANLSGTSGVSFNGIPVLCWTADSNTQVTAVVPRGATSGPIAVTTLYGMATSADTFTVLPAAPAGAGHITFSSARAGNYAIYVMNADGSNQTRLTNNTPGEFFPAISPDGQRIVFYADPGGVSNEIYVMNSDGSNQTRLTTNTVNDSNPAFSPDGRKIVFQSDRDGNFEIYVMNADGSNPTRLTNNADGDFYPAFSPDGRKIAFTSSRDGNFEIYVMDADGSNQTRLTNNAVDDAFPAFSPDGQLIAFESLRDGNAEIYVMHADGSNLTRLTNNSARDHDPSFSPDGQKIVFLSLRDGGYVLYVMNADGSEQTRLTNFTNDINPYWGSINPVITGFTPAHGWPGTAVTITGANLSGTSGVSFNGTPVLCWTADSNTQVTAVVPRGATSGPITVTTLYGTATSADTFTVAPAGAGHITFSSARDGNFAIYVMNADGSNQTRLTNNSPGEFFPAFSPDGQRIVFYADPDNVSNEIYVMNSDGSNQTRLTTNTVNDSNPAFSPDGRKIVFQSDRDGNFGIYVMNADGSNPSRLTNNADGDFYPAFSPDGRKIAFTSSRDGNYEIYVMDADGSNQTRLTNNAVDDAFPAFSPDGQLIAFESLRDGNAEIYVMHADGSNPTRLTNNAARDLDPSFSPDGQKIVFLSLRDGSYVLYVMNADGSAQTRLTNFTSDINPYWGGGPNAVPVITVANAVTFTNTPKTVDVTVADGDSSLSNTTMIVSAVSGDQSKVTDANIVAGGDGPNRTLTITPEQNVFGDVTITVTANDGNGGSASTDFILSIIPSSQADLYLRPSSTPGYSGEGIINIDGTGQTVSQTVANNVNATYYVTLKNTGTLASAFVITGPAAPAGWTVVYKNVTGGGEDISAAVTGAGWSTPTLAVNNTILMQVLVKASSTVADGAMIEQALLATSTNNSLQQDLVKMQTTLEVRYLPDLYLRPSTVPTYSGIGIYNLDGTDQTVGLSVMKGVKATYYVTTKNNGSVPEALTITGTAAIAGWTVVYKSGATDITSDVTGSGWTTPVLNPNLTILVKVEVTASNAVIAGTVATQTVTVTSSMDSSKQDVNVIHTTIPVVVQPDLSLRPSTVATYSGMGIYNLDGTNQTVGLSVAKGVKAAYYVHVQNNGNVADTFTIKGTPAPAGWTVEYKNYTTGTFITSAVIGAGWTTPSMNPATVMTVVVYVTPGSTVAVGAVATQTVTVTSSTDTSKQDVNVIHTTLPVVVRPDLSLRPSTVATYSGMGIYNLDGTNQTANLSVAKGVKASYYVHVQNNGNIPDMFLITGTPAPAGWTVEYKNYTTGTVITTEVAGAGWNTPLMNPGTLLTLAVYVTPGSTVAGGAIAEQTIMLASSANPTQQDVGVLRTTVPEYYQPDLYLRTSSAITYLGSGIYNLTGEGQTTGASVANNVKATYYVRVQNNGNLPEALRVTGVEAPPGWSVVYKIGATVITGQITGTGWTTPVLAVGGTATVTVEVTPSNAVTTGTVAEQIVTVSSTNNPVQQDVGVLQTTVI